MKIAEFCQCLHGVRIKSPVLAAALGAISCISATAADISGWYAGGYRGVTTQ